MLQNVNSDYMPQRVVVIGAGFSGLSAAAYLAQSGYEVIVIEKNDQVGGRARQYTEAGFVFDMGPSWYWMPEVFEQFYKDFGHTAADFYELVRLDPSYSIWYGVDDRFDVPARMADLEAAFEKYEPGSVANLRRFLAEARYKYHVGMGEFVEKPGLSLLEFADRRVLASVFKLQMFTSVSRYVRNLFKEPRLIKLLEFPVLFLGATPQKTPALYTMMNYADLVLGTWYPMGGMHKIAQAMHAICVEQGVQFEFNTPVVGFDISQGRIRAVRTADGGRYDADLVVGSADYHHIDQELLPVEARQYTPKYWDTRTMAPSSLLFYLGVNKRLNNLEHHNLFFDEDFGRHAHEIYEAPCWPEKPLFYVCVPSKTDPTVAPPGSENLFILVPLAPGLQDSDEARESCYNTVIKRLEALTGQSIAPHVIHKRSFAMRDFESAYNSFKGNAYGLANTLRQTALLKPAIRSKKLNNLYYAGQLTVPGPGMPPSIISGRVVARLIQKQTPAPASQPVA